MQIGSLLRPTSKLALILTASFALAACEDGFQGVNSAQAETEATPGSTAPIKLVERDIESPDVFEKNELALWDGRPSLGGVWVAHPDSKQPERVIIRNPKNGKFVVGALFRREKDAIGSAMQLSSDAAEALGVRAEKPTVLQVTALRRETVNANEPTPRRKAPTDVVTSQLPPSSVESVQPVTGASNTAPIAVASPSTAKGAKFAQIGFFSVKSNATMNVTKMNSIGVDAKIVKSVVNGKTFWRVLAGPASSTAQQRQLLNTVKQQGYTDAYLVSG